MNQAKAMKATLKSSTEKKQPIESTTPNNEVSVDGLSSMKKYVFRLGCAQAPLDKRVPTAGQLQRSLSTSICFPMLRFCETDIPGPLADAIFSD
nr:uncharacterized protein LOC103404784 isoform X2 [Malus domestica]